MSRYARQLQLPQLGHVGQRRLAESHALVLGAGGLGSAIAPLLVGAGVGVVHVVDGDHVALHNLHRQVLYTEDDVGEFKASAAATRLRRLNSQVTVRAHGMRLDPTNVALLDTVDLVVDATDHVPTRALVNDHCVRRAIPWIYGGAVGTSGLVLFVPSGGRPCLRCVFPDLESPRPTCAELGVLNTLPALVGSLQASLAIKVLSGEAPSPTLWSVDPWRGSFETLPLAADPYCPACGGTT